jgi:hypothetical protein
MGLLSGTENLTIDSLDLVTAVLSGEGKYEQAEKRH